MTEDVNNSKNTQTYQEFYRASSKACTQAHESGFSSGSIAAAVETLKDVSIDDIAKRGHAVAVIRVISTADGITTEQRDDFYLLLKETNRELFEFNKRDNKYGHFPNPKFD